MVFEEAQKEALRFAERIYDQVIRRWGNVSYAQSNVYDWIWSEDFLNLYKHLNEVERGQLRVIVMQRFRVKPWPWYPSQRHEPPLDPPLEQ